MYVSIIKPPPGDTYHRSLDPGASSLLRLNRLFLLSDNKKGKKRWERG